MLTVTLTGADKLGAKLDDLQPAALAAIAAKSAALADQLLGLVGQKLGGAVPVPAAVRLARGLHSATSHRAASRFPAHPGNKVTTSSWSTPPAGIRFILRRLFVDPNGSPGRLLQFLGGAVHRYFGSTFRNGQAWCRSPASPDLHRAAFAPSSTRAESTDAEPRRRSTLPTTAALTWLHQLSSGGLKAMSTQRCSTAPACPSASPEQELGRRVGDAAFTVANGISSASAISRLSPLHVHRVIARRQLFQRKMHTML